MKKVKPNKMPKPKRPNLKTLDSKLDAVYSKYIRLRDSKDGIHSICYTCGKVDEIKNLDNGHYISRTKRATKYDERNTHTQCSRCNKFLNGNLAEYAVNLENEYGEGILQELLTKSKTIFKATTNWYEEKIKYYTMKYKELDKYNLWG